MIPFFTAIGWFVIIAALVYSVDLTRDLFYYAQTHGLLWCLCRESGVRYPTPITVPGGVQWTAPVKGAGR